MSFELHQGDCLDVLRASGADKLVPAAARDAHAVDLFGGAA